MIFIITKYKWLLLFTLLFTNTTISQALINSSYIDKNPNVVDYNYQKLDSLGVVAPSTIFSLQVDTQFVYVEDYQDYHVAHFAFSGTRTLKLVANENINTVTISPKSYGISYTTNGKELTFNITSGQVKPRYLIIQVNSLEKMVILADEFETDIPASTGPGIYNVTEAPYNADNTWNIDATASIQAAINDACAFGGGTVYVPAGAYLVKDQITMKSNMNLYLEGGAVIKSSTNLNDIDLIKGSSRNMTESMFMYSSCNNVKIYGRGILDASGTDLMNWETEEYRRKILDCTSSFNTNLTIEGIVVKNGTTWTINLRKTTNPQVKNVKVINHKDALTCKIQNDGIDLCSSNNGTVDGCFVMTVDDAMCAKAQNSGVPTYNLTFKNNITYNYCAGNKVGMQSRGEMYNIVFKNNDIVAARRGIVVESTSGSSKISDITFEECRVEEFITAGYTKRAIEFIAEEADVKNIIVKKCQFEGNSLQTSPSIQQFENMSLDSVTFMELIMDGKLITNASQGKIQIEDATNVIFYDKSEYELNVDIIGPGSVDVSPLGRLYEAGTVVSLTASPTDTSYVFDFWSGDLSGAENPKVITLNSDKNITATFHEKISTSVDELQTGKYYLSQNFPNPVLTSTTIEYTLPKQSFVTLKVYDLLGKELTTLVSENKQEGQYKIEFNRNNLRSGLYIYSLNFDGFAQTKKMILK